MGTLFKLNEALKVVATLKVDAPSRRVGSENASGETTLLQKRKVDAA